MIHSFAVFCLVAWPLTCRTIELAPADGHAATSTMECAMGGMMISSAEFTYEGDLWRLKGIYCREEPSEVQAWLRDQH